jgi:hypothetical protein
MRLAKQARPTPRCGFPPLFKRLGSRDLAKHQIYVIKIKRYCKQACIALIFMPILGQIVIIYRGFHYEVPGGILLQSFHVL